jgi:hypothetical protein
VLGGCWHFVHIFIILVLAVAMGWFEEEVIVLALRGAWLVLVAALGELSLSSGVLDSVEVGEH